MAAFRARRAAAPAVERGGDAAAARRQPPSMSCTSCALLRHKPCRAIGIAVPCRARKPQAAADSVCQQRSCAASRCALYRHCGSDHPGAAHADQVRLPRASPRRRRCNSTARASPASSRSRPTKPLTTQRDLSLAYSPGVAVPVLAIAQDPAARLRLHQQGRTWWRSSPTARRFSASAISARRRPSR